MARFNGKPVIQVKVADGINKAEELINEALSGNAPIYHADHISTTVESENDESVGRQIVIGGGILIALAFLFDDYTIDPSNFGKNTPLAAFFKTTGDTAFGFMLPILAGYISMSISDRPGLAVGFVGGALASQGNSGFLGALVVGSAVAGALSMFFNCTLMAPHGGIFVIGVISNPLGYLFALAIGSVVGMFGLALLKKPLK